MEFANKVYGFLEKLLSKYNHSFEDHRIEYDREGNVKVYIPIIKIPESELIRRAIGYRKITLGHMCEIEISNIYLYMKTES